MYGYDQIIEDAVGFDVDTINSTDIAILLEEHGNMRVELAEYISDRRPDLAVDVTRIMSMIAEDAMNVELGTGGDQMLVGVVPMNRRGQFEDEYGF
jgi:hypothetical protein